MEALCFSLLLAVLLPILVLLLLFKTRSWSRTHTISDEKLPPGPRQLPIIGSLHHLLKGSKIPHRMLADLAKRYGPLVHLRLGEITTVVVSSAELVSEMFTAHDVHFASRPAVTAMKIVTYDCKGMTFAPYGGYWRQTRKLCVLELLTARRVQSFRPIREEDVFDLVRSIYSSSSLINLTTKLASFTSSVVSRTAFGTSCKESEEFLSAVHEVIKLAPGLNLADLFPSWRIISVLTGVKRKSMGYHRKFDRIIENIISEHKERRRSSLVGGEEEEEEAEDLVDVLLRLQEHGGLEYPLTNDHIKAIIMDIFSAGSETTSTLMDWVMAELIRHPRVMEIAQAEVRGALRGKEKVTEEDIHELHYLKLVIKETLRLHPPAPLLAPRLCRETCVLGGYTIPEKATVIVNAWAIARDPKHWDEPESFKPERFDGSAINFKGTNFEYIPFGSGRRMCPGILFAIAAVELALAQLLYYFDWKLPQGMGVEDLDMTEVAGSGSQRRSNLLVYAVPCVPLQTLQT